MKSTDVVILGGGAAGCATAYYLAKEGVKATMVEKEAIGSHASGFAFGGLNYYSGAGIPGPVFPLAREAFRLHESLFHELLDSTGVDTYYRKGTNLKLAFTDDELKGIEDSLDWQRKEGLPVELIDGDEARRIEPRINQEVIGASRMEDGAAVEAYRYVLALIQAAEKMGANQRHGSVTGIKRNGNRPSAVLVEGGEIKCDTVVVALGPWSAQASQWLGFPVPVEPLKGQILRLQLNGPPMACSVSFHSSYAGSKPDGLIWCGTTEEWVGFDEAISTEGRTKVMNDALKMVPALGDAQLALQTACLRPLSVDQLPIIGPVPGWEGVYLCTGAGRKGILLSAVMGKIIADLITRGKTSLDISALLPSRFAPVRSP
ncbi:MAG: NAD(P)/FAD-dependent oxidoreductase [Dehalococcoidia bacterium]